MWVWLHFWIVRPRKPHRDIFGTFLCNDEFSPIKIFGDFRTRNGNEATRLLVTSSFWTTNTKSLGNTTPLITFLSDNTSWLSGFLWVAKWPDVKPQVRTLPENISAQSFGGMMRGGRVNSADISFHSKHGTYMAGWETLLRTEVLVVCWSDVWSVSIAAAFVRGFAEIASPDLQFNHDKNCITEHTQHMLRDTRWGDSEILLSHWQVYKTSRKRQIWVTILKV